jgi:glycosyltransferase involved in cell wall biosynthesis
MRLGITSDCVHFRTTSGEVATETHIFCRQIEALSMYFDSVVICCPFIDFNEGVSYSVYSNPKISFIEAPKVGGNTFSHKLQLIKTIPTWLRLFKRLDTLSDILYQRFPNNLNIPGFFYFYFKRKKVFATFTGSWDRDPVASFSTRVQRFLLRNFFRGPVWVYTNSEKLPKHILSGFSPSYTTREWEEETPAIHKRISNRCEGKKVLKLISVGTLCERKNHLFILKTCMLLKKANIPFKLAIVGSGERMEEYQNFILENDLNDSVELTGSVHYSDLKKIYRSFDYVVQSPISEGYGKVAIEGYFHGLIPVLSNVSIFANQMTNNQRRGFTFDLKDDTSLFKILQYLYYEFPEEKRREMICDGRSFVKQLTIDEWAKSYIEVIERYYFHKKEKGQKFYTN